MSITRWFLWVVPIVLFVAGCAVLYTVPDSGQQWIAVNQNFVRQILYGLVGVLCALLIANVSPQVFRNRKIVTWLYVIVLLLLVLVLIVGSTVKGAKSWFDFGFFSLQPADLGKIVFVLVLSLFFAKRHMAIRNLSIPLLSLVYLILPVGLILLQPDFGTAVVYIGIWLGIVLFAGLSWKHIIVVLCAVVLIATGAWMFLFAEYQKDRVRSFLDPLQDPYGSGYNAMQSVVAVGAGQLLGRGFGEGTQSRLAYLPEHHTDFIFASFVEEWGFVGAVAIIGLFTAWVVVLIRTTLVTSANNESLYIIGYVVLLCIHFTIHVGMNIGIVPVTGLPMPFMSFGGSHILTEWIGFGIVLAMTRTTHHARSYRDVEFLGPTTYSPDAV